MLLLQAALPFEKNDTPPPTGCWRPRKNRIRTTRSSSPSASVSFLRSALRGQAMKEEQRRTTHVRRAKYCRKKSTTK